jgi:hypothetical protein
MCLKGAQAVEDFDYLCATSHRTSAAAIKVGWASLLVNRPAGTVDIEGKVQ